MHREDGLQVGSDGEGYRDPPLSRAEELLQTHPDIQVVRGIYGFGEVYITQRVGHRWRNILVDLEHEEVSQRHYPTVVISAYESHRRTYYVHNAWLEETMRNGDIRQRHIQRHGLTTLVKVHVEDDEQVTPEVG